MFRATTDQGSESDSLVQVHGQGGVAASETDLKAHCQEQFDAYRLCMRAWQDAQAAARDQARAAAAAARANS